MKYLRVAGDKKDINTLSRLGLGTMRMTNDRKEGIRTIQKALDVGINYLNTGDFYSAGVSESMVGEALKGRKRENAFVSVKFGGLQTLGGGMNGIDVRPETIENYLVYSLKRLNLDYIDLYEPGRINAHIPVEDTIGSMANLVKKGYVKTIGVTEVNAEQLRRAHATHPISMVEVTYSLINRHNEDDIFPTARELGIGIVGFGTLLGGMIGGRTPQQTIDIMSRMLPPVTVDNMKQNLMLARQLQHITDKKGITLAQLAIAWVLSQGDDIMALVGSRTVNQLNDTIRAMDVTLTAEDLERIEKIIPKEMALSNYMPAPNFKANGYFDH